ncbi:MAG: HIT domain-containing protein [Lentisphaeria bacterium]|nr:HIT domain-containing protein [Lentisphaeria bacterium]
MTFELDQRLANDTIFLDRVGDVQIRIHKNANVLWFILVPETNEIEWIDLSQEHQDNLQLMIDQLSLFLKQTNSFDKINLATIGNVVNQFHYHVIGRSQSDPYWPGVVWGADAPLKNYSEAEVDKVKYELALFLAK